MKKRIPTLNEFINESSEGDKIYSNSLNDNYWNEVTTKFPNFNNYGSYDHANATEWILNKMKKEYENIEWETYEDELRNKIKDALL